VPLAGASVVRVHAATLRTGEDVVVKVQHPGARSSASTAEKIGSKFP
jgi:ubiquinone biosynthesis protein